jgi:hypothetical protein
MVDKLKLGSSGAAARRARGAISPTLVAKENW